MPTFEPWSAERTAQIVSEHRGLEFFASQGPESAVTGTAEHIKKFWDPRMLAAIFAYLDDGGAGLDPAVRQAIERLKSAS